MEMKRRNILIGLPLTALAAGCHAGTQQQVAHPYRELESIEGDSKSAATVLVFMPDTPQSQEVWRGLRDEIGEEFKLVSVDVKDRNSVKVLRTAIERHRPQAVVLMNNPTLAAYRDYQTQYQGEKFPPAFVVMTSFLSQQSPLISTTGVSYEVPLITVVTNLRKVVDTPVDRVGIVARAGLRRFIQDQADLAKKEKITAVVEEVGENPNAAEIKRAIRSVKNRADALWVLNDNQLLTPRLISDGWVPGMNERPWIPVIVGAAPLVSPGANFGTFALIPDHPSLGAQVANMIFDLADNDWTLSSEMSVQIPVSTISTMDLVQAHERLALRDDALQKVDRVLR
jgi:hypothetical protein